MNIVSKIPYSETVTKGVFSDGSDRHDVTNITWVVELQDNGHMYRCTFDHDPTDEEILAADKEDITSPTDLLQTQTDFLTLQILDLMGV